MFQTMADKQIEIETLRSENDSLNKRLSAETDLLQHANFQLVQFQALVEEKMKEIQQLKSESKTLAFLNY